MADKIAEALVAELTAGVHDGDRMRALITGADEPFRVDGAEYDGTVITLRSGPVTIFCRPEVLQGVYRSPAVDAVIDYDPTADFDDD